jgi:hypothetical protein
MDHRSLPLRPQLFFHFLSQFQNRVKAEKVKNPRFKRIQTQIHEELGMNHLGLVEIRDSCLLSGICGAAAKRVSSSMGFSMASNTKRHQVLRSVIAQPASRLNVMDLKILHASAPLAPPSISLQNFTAKFSISFRIKP